MKGIKEKKEGLNSDILHRPKKTYATRPSTRRGREDSNPVPLRAERETSAGGGGIRLSPNDLFLARRIQSMLDQKSGAHAWSRVFLFTAKKDHQPLL